jgi:hypothetical protein
MGHADLRRRLRRVTAHVEEVGRGRCAACRGPVPWRAVLLMRIDPEGKITPHKPCCSECHQPVRDDGLGIGHRGQGRKVIVMGSPERVPQPWISPGQCVEGDSARHTS